MGYAIDNSYGSYQPRATLFMIRVQIKSRLIISQQFNNVDFLCKLCGKTPFNARGQNKP